MSIKDDTEEMQFDNARRETALRDADAEEKEKLKAMEDRKKELEAQSRENTARTVVGAIGVSLSAVSGGLGLMGAFNMANAARKEIKVTEEKKTIDEQQAKMAERLEKLKEEQEKKQQEKEDEEDDDYSPLSRAHKRSMRYM